VACLTVAESGAIVVLAAGWGFCAASARSNAAFACLDNAAFCAGVSTLPRGCAVLGGVGFLRGPVPRGNWDPVVLGAGVYAPGGWVLAEIPAAGVPNEPPVGGRAAIGDKPGATNASVLVAVGTPAASDAAASPCVTDGRGTGDPDGGLGGDGSAGGASPGSVELRFLLRGFLLRVRLATGDANGFAAGVAAGVACPSGRLMPFSCIAPNNSPSCFELMRPCWKCSPTASSKFFSFAAVVPVLFMRRLSALASFAASAAC